MAGPGIIHRLLHTHLAGGEVGSLMANDTDDLFIRLLAVFIFSLEKCLVKFVAHFNIG